MTEDSSLMPVPDSREEQDPVAAVEPEELVPDPDMMPVKKSEFKTAQSTQVDPNDDVIAVAAAAEPTAGPASEPTAEPNAEPTVEPPPDQVAGPYVEQNAKLDADLNANPNVRMHVEPLAELYAEIESEDDLEYFDDATEDLDDNSDGDNDNAEASVCYKVTFLIFVIISFMTVILSVLIVGLILFMYYLQEPIDVDHYPLKLITRARWDLAQDYYQFVRKTTFIAKRIAVVHTETEEFDTPEDCAHLLMNIEQDFPLVKYNFVVSKSGYVYEALGWNEPSPMYAEVPTLVIAFIGNYEKVEPSEDQLEQLKILISESMARNYLTSTYSVVGRKLREIPTKLFEFLNKWDEWNWEDSDSEEVPIDFEPFLITDE